MITTTQQTVLRLLFIMASEGCPADRYLLAAELELSDQGVGELLEQLDEAGLVNARRLRLTMVGLALAVTLPRARRQRTSCDGANQAA